MKHVGYVIANHQEEFLRAVRDTSTMTVIAWVRSPALAKVYRDKDKALRLVLRLSRRLWVLELYESDTQFCVFAQGDDVPPWLQENARNANA